MRLDLPAEYRLESAEVLYSSAEVITVDRAAIERFKRLSLENPRRRIRLCAHSNPGDRLHEMLIVHESGAYVRPHKHPGKMESTHVIEGLVDVVLFDDQGSVLRTIRMGDYASVRTFYHRTAVPMFHTLIVRLTFSYFMKPPKAPFTRDDTVFARWEPVDGGQ